MKELEEALRNVTQTLRLMLAAVSDYPADARKEVRDEIALAEAALSRVTSEPTDSDFLSIPMVIDRATGAKGAYCIRRFRNELRYEGTFNTAEYWNLGKWTAFCYVFNDKKLADCVCELLALAGETHTAGGWISVETSPEEIRHWANGHGSEWMLTHGREGFCIGSLVRHDDDGKRVWRDWAEGPLRNVTHWQPLPSPPKEGQ